MPEARPHFTALDIERRDHVLTIILNRPEKLNAFDAVMHRELPDALAYAAQDPVSDVIVLTGAGRAFSAGGDIDWQLSAAERPALFEATVREAKQIVFGILDCEKPVIARVNGPAVGLGATIALMCDVIFVAESAYIADPHVSIGMVAGDGGALIWPQLIGFARAKHYLFTGERISAQEAADIGLVNWAMKDDFLDEAVNAYADRLCAGAQAAIRYTKLAVNAPLRQIVSASMDIGLGYESLTNVSPDHFEALEAFGQKRPPRFGAERTGRDQ